MYYIVSLFNIAVLKKIAALFFLIVFAFNWFGYRLLIDFMQKKANEQLEAKLDNNAYDESQLIELKIPVHLPYQNNWTSYQRYDGQIEINGVHYKYVKRKLLNDTLFLKCIPNNKVMHLQSAKDEFFKISNDLAQNDHPKKSDNSNSFFRNLQTVYDNAAFGADILSMISVNQHLWLIAISAGIISNPHFIPSQPPDLSLS